MRRLKKLPQGPDEWPQRAGFFPAMSCRYNDIYKKNQHKSTSTKAGFKVLVKLTQEPRKNRGKIFFSN